MSVRLLKFNNDPNEGKTNKDLDCWFFENDDTQTNLEMGDDGSESPNKDL